MAWVEKDSKEPYKKLREIIKRLNELLNRKASSLSEIDEVNNIGLRVANCLKDGGEILFDKETGLYFANLRYNVVISEDESFAPEDAGNRPWISC